MRTRTVERLRDVTGNRVWARLCVKISVIVRMEQFLHTFHMFFYTKQTYSDTPNNTCFQNIIHRHKLNKFKYAYSHAHLLFLLRTGMAIHSLNANKCIYMWNFSYVA